MLLAIDIGNSATKFGVFERENLIARFIIPTVRTNTAEEISSQIKGFSDQRFSAVAVSSVVPELNDVYRKFAAAVSDSAAFFADNRCNFNLRVKCIPPENVGVDRLVAAFAAVKKYGKPCIVCDFGTATTIDAVNFESEFLGGVIVAGMRLLADALFHKTSKLPPVELVKPVKVIGDSTVKAIQSGTYFGYLGLVDGIISRMTDELGETPRIVATGGFAELIAAESVKIETVDANLLLEGLRLLNETRFQPKQ